MLSIVSIVAADPVGSLEIAPVTEVLLARVLSGTVSFLAHDIFSALDGLSLIFDHIV